MMRKYDCNLGMTLRGQDAKQWHWPTL